MASSRWYSEGLRFTCTQCGRCCTIPGYVWMDREEMSELADFLGLPFDEFTKRYVRRVGNRYSLIEKPTSECIFWQGTGPKRGCQVYAARPRQCRTFPFWEENIDSEPAWNEVVRDCPGTGEGRLYEVDEIHRLVREEGETGFDGAPGGAEAPESEKPD